MSEDFLGAILSGQSIGIPMAPIRDVLGPQTLMPVPLAPHGILGLLNLRGRIVTAIDLRVRLGMPIAETPTEPAFVTVDSGGELYALLVDAVTDVTTVVPEEVEPVPSHLAPVWHAVAHAVYAAPASVMVLLSVDKLLGNFAIRPIAA